MRTLLTITLLCQSLHLLAQPANLVPNGGFEEYKKCAGDWSGIQIVGAPTQSVEHWFRPTNGTPDYFNACSNTEQTALPANLIGHTEPKDDLKNIYNEFQSSSNLNCQDPENRFHPRVQPAVDAQESFDNKLTKKRQ
jgi:hypothetical protein